MKGWSLLILASVFCDAWNEKLTLPKFEDFRFFGKARVTDFR